MNTFKLRGGCTKPLKHKTQKNCKKNFGFGNKKTQETQVLGKTQVYIYFWFTWQQHEQNRVFILFLWKSVQNTSYAFFWKNVQDIVTPKKKERSSHLQHMCFYFTLQATTIGVKLAKYIFVFQLPGSWAFCVQSHKKKVETRKTLKKCKNMRFISNFILLQILKKNENFHNLDNRK